MVVAPSVAPSANDMILPESVMKVMPMATQPMNDIVVISDTRLTVDRHPGAPSATKAMSRIASSARWRRLGGSHWWPLAAVLTGGMASECFGGMKSRRLAHTLFRHPEVLPGLFGGGASKGDGPDVATPGASGEGGGRASFEGRASARPPQDDGTWIESIEACSNPLSP